MSHGFPDDNAELTHTWVVSDVALFPASAYTDVLGAELYREYGGEFAVLLGSAGRGCCWWTGFRAD